MADETKLCSNCKRDIAAANFVMHEVHCRRHIILCEQCGEPVHRSEIEQHVNDLHAKIPCEKCQLMIPRSDMTKHLTEDCNKKMMKCEFCEISLPKNELEAHLDYCGSRTECCPLCKQYIMQKDKLRHETSRCTYPEARPQPADPFSMGDLQQFMTSAVLGNRHPANNITRRGKIPANRKSNLNAQMAKNMLIPEVPDVSLSSLPPDVDYDSMLALQLAHEDWFQDGEIESNGDNWDQVPHYPDESSSGFNDFLDFSREPWSFLASLQSSEPTGYDTRTAQEIDQNMSVPCEFCEEMVPLNFYIVHMESCPLALQRRDADLNNEQAPPQPKPSKAMIPVINNLRPSTPPPPLWYHAASEDDDDDDNVLLPCEFCQETFPSDFIIQHQSICKADGIVTPRAATPTNTNRNVQPQQPSSQTSFKPSVRSPTKRPKKPAVVGVLSQEDSHDLANTDMSNIFVQKVNESSSNKYSPAYNRFDEALTRPPRRSTKQQSLSSDEAPEVKIESRSTQRTRANLNQLLQEDSSPEGVSLGNRKKELGILRRHDVNKTDSGDGKSKVESRPAAARRQEDTRQKPAHGRAPLPQNGSNPSRASQTSTTRSRQRADHVFSPELRLKPNNSPPPKKR